MIRSFHAALLAAALLFICLCGACSFRPAGVGRADVTTASDTATDAPVTADVGGTPDTLPPAAETSAPDTTPPVTLPPPETEPPKPAEKRISMLAVGDNIIHEAVFLDARARATGGAEYDFVPMYTGVASAVAAADIAFVNHETPMAGKEYGIYGYPTFNSPREAGEALVSVGFDVVNLANNHIFDMRASGARATLEYVRTLPVTEIGVYSDTADAANVRVTEVNGISVAWLSYCYGSNGAYDPATAGIIMPLFDDEQKIRAEVRAARQQADFVIVSAHWGLDDVAGVTDLEKRWASVLADAGADVILGHHPHILQPVEWIACSDGRRTLAAYSLGNFLSTQFYSRNMVGGMITFDLIKDADGKCSVAEPVLHPIVTHYTMARNGLQIYMLEDYTQELAALHGCRANSPDFTLAWVYSHVRSIVSDEFLPAYFES